MGGKLIKLKCPRPKPRSVPSDQSKSAMPNKKAWGLKFAKPSLCQMLSVGHHPSDIFALAASMQILFSSLPTDVYGD